ncbi:hypothetical protein JCM16303_002807 [Sporobolomyces ruberrimus]
MTTQVTGDLLCLILDLNPSSWASSDTLSLDAALDQILVFANSHLALRHENQIALFAATNKTSRQLYSSQLPPRPEEEDPFETDLGREERRRRERDSNVYQSFRIVDENVVKGVKNLIKELPPSDSVSEQGARKGVNLVGALSMALCHINRLSLSASSSSATTTGNTSTTDSNKNSASSSSSENNAKVQPRILILSVTPDEPSQYVPIMNCIFTAQKSGISIDCLKILGKTDSTFLQQATHLTGGTYYKLPPSGTTRSGLVQYLIVNFLSGPLASKHLNRAKQDQVDLRAACFCHRKIVDLGYVCSVCLSIFCSPLPVCTTCRTKFPMSTLKRLGFGARPRPAGGTNGNGGTGTKKRKMPPPGGATRGTASPGPPPHHRPNPAGPTGGANGS